MSVPWQPSISETYHINKICCIRFWLTYMCCYDETLSHLLPRAPTQLLPPLQLDLPPLCIDPFDDSDKLSQWANDNTTIQQRSSSQKNPTIPKEIRASNIGPLQGVNLLPSSIVSTSLIQFSATIKVICTMTNPYRLSWTHFLTGKYMFAVDYAI